MFGYKEMVIVLTEIGNVSVAINGFETPAKPFKTNKKKKIHGKLPILRNNDAKRN